MTLFIYNHPISGEQIAVEAIGLSDDCEIIWSGESWAQFEAETGCNQGQVGGLKFKNKNVVFDEAKHENSKAAQKPIAMGLDLLKFMDSSLQLIDDDKVLDLLEKFDHFVTLLQSPRSNPCTKRWFDKAVARLSKKFTNGDKELIMSILNEWVSTVRFAPPRPEVVKQQTKR